MLRELEILLADLGEADLIECIYAYGSIADGVYKVICSLERRGKYRDKAQEWYFKWLHGQRN